MITLEKLVIPLDKEHGALRLAIMAVFIVSWIVLFIILSALIPNDGFSLLAIILGFAGAYLTTALAERYLRGRWTSGRVIEVDVDGIRMKRGSALEGEVLSEDPAAILLWRFTVNRRSRVPKGHSVFACAVQYEAEFLPVYTFLSPKQVDSFPDADRFTKLVSAKQASGGREDLRLAGEQRRLREAENHRWGHGGEMTSDDFLTFYSRLKAQYSAWLDSKSS